MTLRQKILIFLAALLAGLLIMFSIAAFTGRLALPGGLFSHPGAPAAHVPEILYLSPTSGTAAVWRVAPGSGAPKLLTRGVGSVIDFAPSPDGEWIAFMAENNLGGSDLWLVDRGSNRQHVLVRCGADRCEAPVWSPDGRQILFGRSAAPSSPNGQSLALPWLVEPSSGHSQRLDNDPLVGFLAGSWSPDGKRLAFYDLNAKGIRVRELANGKEVVLQTSVTSTGSWSPDGGSILFNVEETYQGFSYMKVYQMDFATGKSTLLLGKEESDASDYGLPQFSPDGQWLVYNLRTLGGSPSKQLRLMHPDGSSMKMITSDLGYSNAGYHWSPDGHSILFQRFAFGSSENVPEVVVWSISDSKLSIVAQDAAMPKWLP